MRVLFLNTMNSLTHSLIFGIIFLITGGGVYYALDHFNYQFVTMPVVVENEGGRYATTTFSGTPHANVRYKDKDGVRFEIYSERKEDDFLNFVKSVVPVGEKIMSSVPAGHTVRALAEREVVAYLPSKKAIDAGGKVLGPLLLISNDDRSYDFVLDRNFNLSKDDNANFNLPLTPDNVFDDVWTVYHTGSPNVLFDLMKKYQTKFVVILPGDVFSGGPLVDNTIVAGRMMRGQEVNCFSLIKTSVATSSAAGGVVLSSPRGALYKTADSCAPAPTIASLSSRPPLWQENFESGAGSWLAWTSLKDVTTLPRFERQSNGNGQMFLVEYPGGVKYFHKEIKFPSKAQYLVFDHYFTGASGEESLRLLFGESLLLDERAKDWSYSSYHPSSIIDIRSHAGTTADLNFTFQGDAGVRGEKGGAKLYLDNIRVY